MRVVVRWTRTRAEWSPDVLAEVRSSLPADVLERMPRYRRWQDRQIGLLGKRLLQRVLREAGRTSDLIGVRWSEHGRPTLPGGGDFSIAHSQLLVGCAWSATGRLGFDLEPVRAFDPDDLGRVLTARELASIAAAADSDAELFRIWTTKEAVVKADGRGVAAELGRVEALSGTIELDGVRWHVVPVSLCEGIAAQLATSETAVQIDVAELPESELLRW